MPNASYKHHNICDRSGHDMILRKMTDTSSFDFVCHLVNDIGTKMEVPDTTHVTYTMTHSLTMLCQVSSKPQAIHTNTSNKLPCSLSACL